MLERVVPLTLTVVAMQNGQGFAILRTAGYEPPEDGLATACGFGTTLGGRFGSVPICVTGPTTGILNTSGPEERRRIGGVVFGAVFALLRGVRPDRDRSGPGAPGEFHRRAGWAAPIPVLASALAGAFARGRHRSGP